jgi:N-carbamoylputrescine amidase
MGEILGRASPDQEENLIVPVDLGQLDTTRTQWPFLRDRRVDAYRNLSRLYTDGG